MVMKSETCIGKISGKALTEYESEREAQEGADHAQSRYGRKLDPSGRHGVDFANWGRGGG